MSERAERSRPQILHCFADSGTESEVLMGYGDVIRVGINVRDTNDSVPIQADAHQLPFPEDLQFDLGLFHPPCTAWADTTSISGDPAKHEAENNLIPLAREIADRHCHDWVIENKPTAPLHDPVVLNGRMFGLPIAYERAFETSFHVPQPPRHKRFGNGVTAETSPFFFSGYAKEWWASVKGYRADRYAKQHLAKNCIPAPYIHHICRAWWDAYEARTGSKDRTDYSNYDEEMENDRRETANQSIYDYLSESERPEAELDSFGSESDTDE